VADAEALRYVDALLSRDQLKFSYEWVPNRGWIPTQLASYEATPPGGYNRSVSFQTRNDRSGFDFAGFGPPAETLYSHAHNFFCASSYRFRAERVIPARCPIQASPVLAQNGSNLGAVLLHLQANRKLYDELMSHVRSIFSNVEHVSVIPVSGNECEVRIWTFDPSTGRQELTASLDESGTGIAQVLAILYVVVASTETNTIIIDEPNSYLNPGAARNLVQILKSTPHQYIITTHSPEIIAASEPDTINLLSWDRGATVVTGLSSGDIAGARKILLAVGSKLSDVFGSDNVLWVEGPTEAECFRRILSHFNKLPLGTTILPVRNTGDFESKRAPIEMVWEIYERLTSNNALLPTAVAFSFDRDGRSDRDIEDMVRRSRGRVHFLPRRMFEDYLLHPTALAYVLNTMEAFANNPVSPERIDTWLTERASLKEYDGPGAGSVELSQPDQLRRLDGAKLLKDLVTELSDAKHQYNEIAQGIDLTSWLLLNDPGRFDELLEYLTLAITRSDTAAAGR
jgi:hypothetical protein